MPVGLPGAHTMTPVMTAEASAPRPRRPSREELAVWRKFLRVQSQTLPRLEADLLAEQDLALASYDVLVQLVEAPEHRLRMTDLADRVLLSRSGLTRLVDRLVREGLVVREACASDARGMFAVLSEAGYDRLRRASVTHLRGISTHVVDRLTPQELERLGQILDRLLDDPAPPGS